MNSNYLQAIKSFEIGDIVISPIKTIHRVIMDEDFGISIQNIKTGVIEKLLPEVFDSLKKLEAVC